MQKNLVMKGLVIGILVLFFGADGTIDICGNSSKKYVV